MEPKRSRWRWTEGDKTQDVKQGTQEDFYEAIAAGRLTSNDMFWTEGFPGGGIPYSALQDFKIRFQPSIEEISKSRLFKPVTVYAGPNNGGKSLVLKRLLVELGGDNAYLVGCNRFYHVYRLTAGVERTQSRFYGQFFQQFYTANQNLEQNQLPLDQIITSISNNQRERLLALCGEMLGNTFSLKKVDEDNDFSAWYIDMDGENLGYGSTGTRLLMTLLGICLDDRFDALLIDEPELGLSPRIQSILAHYLFTHDLRRTNFPHLKNVFIATHSHLFLDRGDLANNFIVSKAGHNIFIEQVQSVSRFHQLQFDLLGNELESLFLPSAIVLVEGSTDHAFISKLVQIFVPQKRITIVDCKGSGRIPEKLNTLKEAFGDLERSPYIGRILVVLDKTHDVKLESLKRQGIEEDKIVVFKNNGIEYYYPREILSEVFSCGEDIFDGDWVTGDPIEINGIRKTKMELSNTVVGRLHQGSNLSDEVRALLHKVQEISL